MRLICNYRDECKNHEKEHLECYKGYEWAIGYKSVGEGFICSQDYHLTSKAICEEVPKIRVTFIEEWHYLAQKAVKEGGNNGK